MTFGAVVLLGTWNYNIRNPETVCWRRSHNAFVFLNAVTRLYTTRVIRNDVWSILISDIDRQPSRRASVFNYTLASTSRCGKLSSASYGLYIKRSFTITTASAGTHSVRYKRKLLHTIITIPRRRHSTQLCGVDVRPIIRIFPGENFGRHDRCWNGLKVIYI